MKKVTIQLDGSGQELKAAGQMLNELSGVVATDIDLSSRTANAYSGDRMSADLLAETARQSGCQARVIQENAFYGSYK